MKEMNIIFKGKEAVVRKENFYCKAGAYDHKWRSGWAIFSGEDMVVGGIDCRTNLGAERYDYPIYTTRKSILAELDYYDKDWKRV